MALTKRSYGPWSRRMLASLRARGLLKVEALVAWLGQRDIAVDRTLVSHWIAGRAHLPADVLPHLAAFAGRADLVFDEYLRDQGFAVVSVPRGEDGDDELTDRMMEISAALGRLQQALLDARAPESDGGAAITPAEQHVLRERLDELFHLLADLRAQLGHRSYAR